MSRKFLVAMTALASVLRYAWAEDSVQRVTLEQALQMFEENNLELRLAEAERDRALGSVRQARVRPNPVAAVSHEGLSENERDQSESYFTLSQRFEWPGRRGARIERSQEEAAAQESRLAAERRRLAFEVKRAFIQASAAEERAAVVGDVVTVFRVAEASGRRRYGEGDLSGYDARRLRIERARYENLGASAEINLRSRRLELASLILPGDGEEASSLVAPAAPPEGLPPTLRELDEDAAIGLALERRPDMRAAEAQIAAAEASIRYFSTFTGPDVTLTGGYKRQSDGLDGYFLSVNVPLPTFDRGKGNLEASEAGLRAALARAELTRRTIANDVRRSLAAFASMSRRIDLIRTELLGEVDDLLRIARVSYSEGEMSLLALLDAAEAFRESQIMESELKAEFWIRYYDLERAIGAAPVVALAGEGNAP